MSMLAVYPKCWTVGEPSPRGAAPVRYCFGSRVRAFDGSEQLDGAEIRDMAGHKASF